MKKIALFNLLVFVFVITSCTNPKKEEAQHSQGSTENAEATGTMEVNTPNGPDTLHTEQDTTHSNK